MIHDTADVSKYAKIGKNTKVWHHVQVRENAIIGDNCILGKGAYIDKDVKIGSNVKIQNYASIYSGSTIEDGVFIGPNVVLTNDTVPRAINPDGSLMAEGDWKTGKILVKKGASIGAKSVILPDVVIGGYSMIGAGSVVTKSVPDYALVYGNPAEIRGFVCKCGNRLEKKGMDKNYVAMECTKCHEKIKIPVNEHNKIKVIK